VLASILPVSPHASGISDVRRLESSATRWLMQRAGLGLSGNIALASGATGGAGGALRGMQRRPASAEVLVNQTFTCSFPEDDCSNDPDHHGELSNYTHCFDGRPHAHDWLHWIMDIDMRCTDVYNENGTELVTCKDLAPYQQETHDLLSHCQEDSDLMIGTCYYVCIQGRPVYRCELRFDPENKHLMRHEAIKKCNWNAVCLNATTELNQVVCTGWDDEQPHPNAGSGSDIGPGQSFERQTADGSAEEESRLPPPPQALNEDGSFSEANVPTQQKAATPATQSEESESRSEGVAATVSERVESSRIASIDGGSDGRHMAYEIIIGVLAGVVVLITAGGVAWWCYRKKGLLRSGDVSPSVSHVYPGGGGPIVVGRPASDSAVQLDNSQSFNPGDPPIKPKTAKSAPPSRQVTAV